MANTKITDLDATVTIVDADVVPIVDISDTSMDAGGTTKKGTFTVIKAFLKTYFDTLYAGVLGADDNYVTDAEKIVIGNTSGTNSGNETTSTLGATINGATAATPNDTDLVATVDTSVVKKITWTNVKAFLKTYFDTLYQATGSYVTSALYDAHSILYATTDNTPVALTVGEQTLVGRATGGNISAIAIDSDLSSVSANDDTVPSAKATKAMGDSKLPLAGGTMTGNITLGENTSIALDPTGSADGKYSGITVTGTAGYTQAFGDLVYLDPTDSRWEAVDANAASGADGDARGMLGMVVSAGTDGNACTILLNGIIRADTAFPTFTVNNPIYVSETAGDVTQTQPTTTDVVIRIVGSALTADEMYFNPEWDYITHT